MNHCFHQTWAVRPISTLALILSAACFASADAATAPTLDPAFKPVLTRPGGFASAVGVQADGKIVLAGAFNAIDGLARNGLARLNADGTVDPSFNAGALCCGGGLDAAALSAPVSALTIQRDGKILIGGSFSEVGGVARQGLARLMSDGSLDPAFDPGTGLASTSTSGSLLPVVAMVEQPDGKVLVGGYFTAVNGVERSGLARLNPDGSVDTAFDPGTALAIGFPDFGPLAGLALLDDGQILVAGSFQAFNDTPRTGLARLNADGSLDGTFDPPIYDPASPPTLNGMLVQSDGRILISGSFYKVEPEFRSGLARLNPDGSVDTTFNLEFDPALDSYRLMALQADEKIIAHRRFTDATGNFHEVIARLNQDGSVDDAFSVELASTQEWPLRVLDLAVQADGGLLIAGSVSPAPDGAQQGILRVSSSGAVDTAFEPELELAEGFDSNVLAVAAQTDGKVLAGGTFTRVNGVARNYLVRFSPDGAVDSSFAPEIESDQFWSGVSAILVQDDGKILIGGVFSTINGVDRAGIAQLNADGSVDTAFDVGPGTRESEPPGEGIIGRVSAFALQGDKVLVAGSFSTLRGQLVPAFGRLNPDGTLDPSFNSGVGVCAMCELPDIRGVHVMTNDLIVVRGNFERVDAFVFPQLARIEMDGLIDLTFAPVISTDDQVSAAVVNRDGKVTAAFTVPSSTGEGSATRLVRFNIDGTLDAAFDPGEILGDGGAAVPVSALALDGQGRLVVAGEFQSIGGAPVEGLARLGSEGTVDASFDVGAGFGYGVLQPGRTAEPLVTSIALQEDGGIVVGGSFGTANHEPRLGIARFQSDSSGPIDDGEARLSIGARGANNAITILISGEVGRAYRIDASSDLRNWSEVGTVTGAAEPQAFVDPEPNAFPQRFFRAVAP